MAFVVYVISGGQLARGVKVTLGFTSTFLGGSETEYTDVSGRASFQGSQQGVVEIHLNGVSFGLYDYRDEASVTLNLDADADEEADE